MNTEGHHLQENVQRLLRAALGGQARLRPEFRAHAYELLKLQLGQHAEAFPVLALAALGSLAGLALVWWIVSSTPDTATTPALVSQFLIRPVAFLNLMIVPFAAFVIIMRRRSHV